jgi:hypothetical protein
MTKTFVITINGKRHGTDKKRRFLYKARTINWETLPTVYLRVSYGLQTNCMGKQDEFYNDGDYTNQQDFDLAAKAFLEEL